jgi:Flp pilus assembly protein TadD
MLAITACASSRPVARLGGTAEAWQTFLEGREVTAIDVPNPLEVTEEMRRTAEDLAGRGSPKLRLENLQNSLYNSSYFPFTYDTEGTYTAAEAFEKREGNCLSFTNMFIAMARSLEIEVTGAVPLKTGRSEHRDDLIIVNNHLVAAYNQAGALDVFDFDYRRSSLDQPVRVIDDAHLAALFLNNRGVERLGRGDIATAKKLFEAVTRLAPAYAGGWGNLGVTRRRSGDMAGAFDAYRQALLFAPSDPVLLTNLAGLYRRQGKEHEAARLMQDADLTEASAHVLIVQGDLLRAAGHFEAARRLYRRARRQDWKSPDPPAARAALELELGNMRAAGRAARAALKSDPQHPEALRVLEILNSQ